MVRENPESKMFLLFFGVTPNLYIHDLDMAQKLLSLVPSKMDRCETDFTKSVLFWLRKSLIMTPTTKNLRQRRKAIVSHLGLSMISRYIPLFIEQCSISLKTWSA